MGENFIWEAFQADILVTITSKGHDSNSIATYSTKNIGKSKYNLQSDSQDETYESLRSFLGQHIKSDFDTWVNDKHAMVELNMEIGGIFQRC